MLLALDIALCTGFAIGGPADGAPRTGTWDLPAAKHNFDRALTILRETVAMTCRTHNVTMLIVESAMQISNKDHSSYARFLLTSLSAVAREAAMRNQAKVEAVDCHVWRKAFIGVGNLSGEEAKASALRRCAQLGWPAIDHNAAESAGVWFWGMATHFPRWNPGRAAA